mmetsp:Transcript_13767/g.54476  ORF Transcript_13767/g.54476 Transcript_13767/m.54476 type:complete len:277 (+) Transcript_13767:1214-2044(+)
MIVCPRPNLRSHLLECQISAPLGRFASVTSAASVAASGASLGGQLDLQQDARVGRWVVCRRARVGVTRRQVARKPLQGLVLRQRKHLYVAGLQVDVEEYVVHRRNGSRLPAHTRQGRLLGSRRQAGKEDVERDGQVSVQHLQREHCRRAVCALALAGAEEGNRPGVVRAGGELESARGGLAKAGKVVERPGVEVAEGGRQRVQVQRSAGRRCRGGGLRPHRGRATGRRRGRNRLCRLGQGGAAGEAFLQRPAVLWKGGGRAVEGPLVVGAHRGHKD